MEPVFFGSSESRLYGVYQAPLSQRRRDTGVVLCYPAMQEYMRTHWAFRKLASQLAREGFHVLRFDWYGTGDSAGEPAQASVEQWCANVREAVAELKDLGDVRRVSLVGFRMGASLAAMAASVGGLDVRDLVLWEPAVQGSSHLSELRQIEKWKFGSLRNPPRTGPHELLGFELPPGLAESVSGIDLWQIPACHAERVWLFASEQRPEYDRLAVHLRDRHDGPAHVRIVPDETGGNLEAVLLSTRVLQAMTTTLAAAA